MAFGSLDGEADGIVNSVSLMDRSTIFFDTDRYFPWDNGDVNNFIADHANELH